MANVQELYPDTIYEPSADEMLDDAEALYWKSVVIEEQLLLARHELDTESSPFYLALEKELQERRTRAQSLTSYVLREQVYSELSTGGQ